jgi:hypothetical protein
MYHLTELNRHLLLMQSRRSQQFRLQVQQSMPVCLFVMYFLFIVALSIQGEAELLKGLKADHGSSRA